MTDGTPSGAAVRALVAWLPASYLESLKNGCVGLSRRTEASGSFLFYLAGQDTTKAPWLRALECFGKFFSLSSFLFRELWSQVAAGRVVVKQAT
jgi:hypothetical protein